MAAPCYLRRSIATLVALALGAWLSLAALLVSTGGQTGPGTGWYVAVGAVGVCVVSIVARWHALWLVPLATAAFAAVYQRWFWDMPDGIPGGTDGIGYYPTDVAWAMFPVVGVAALVLLIKSAWSPWWRRTTSPPQ